MFNWFQKLRARFVLPRSARASHTKGNLVHVGANSEGILREWDEAADQQVIRWQEIVRITAFKRDLYTYDLICLLILSKTGIWELDEKMPGWQETIQMVDTFLPSAVPYAQWFLEIITPAFETTPIDVYNIAGANVAE